MSDTENRDKAADGGLHLTTCCASSEVKYGRVRKLFGIYYIVGIDRDGWWITDKKGYKTMMNAALTKVTAPDGGIAHQLIIGRWMLMLVSPHNVHVDTSPPLTPQDDAQR